MAPNGYICLAPWCNLEFMDFHYIAKIFGPAYADMHIYCLHAVWIKVSLRPPIGIL